MTGSGQIGLVHVFGAATAAELGDALAPHGYAVGEGHGGGPGRLQICTVCGAGPAAVLVDVGLRALALPGGGYAVGDPRYLDRIAGPTPTAPSPPTAATP